MLLEIDPNVLKYINSEPISKVEMPQELYPNEFLSQFLEFVPKELKHRYSIQIYKSHYNPEMYQLTQDYELNVHKRGLDTFNPKFVKDFMAYSPLYDPNLPNEANRASFWEGAQSFSENDENEVGYPPSPGSYHIYHRIDGELVAIGVCDITNSYFNSAYFLYKTKYSYLNLGVVGAIIELEFCRKLQDLWSPELKYYHLGELVLDCPKVNYKLNYQPG